MRGQSAVEYLMTYGWAIVALVIVIGVLLSTGVMSPGFFMQDECSMGTNLPCELAIYNEGDATYLSMVVYNGFPYPIEVQEGLEVVLPGTEQGFVLGSPSLPAIINSGDRMEVRGRFDGPALPVDAYKRFYVSFDYASCAPELLVPGEECSDSVHRISGKIAGRVLPTE